MLEQLKNLVKDEEAPTAVEYALLVAVIALVMVVGAKLLGSGLSTEFSDTATTIKNP
jgi:pilus assembly protein Flp/PilA